MRDLEPLAELGDELGVVLRDGALRPEGPAAVSMWLFDDASEPLPGGFEQSELSPKAPAMSLKSFPQDLVFVARSSVLIKGLAARLGVKWSLASKWAPMAVEALDLNEKDARGVRRRGRLAKLGDGVKARVSRVVAPAVRKEAVDLADRMGMSIMAISDTPVAPIFQVAKHRFVLPTETPQFFSSTLAIHAFFETLMAFVIAQSPASAVESIERFHAHRRKLGVYVDDDGNA